MFSDMASVWVQNPIRINELSEPQSDLALLRRRPDFYGTQHPTPSDTFLVVEIAETSVHFDRQLKMPSYAASGIAEYWLVALEQRLVTVYRDPTPEAYRTLLTVGPQDQVAPQAFPDRVLAASDVLRPD